MYVLLCALAFAAGVVLVVQVGVNATLRTGLGGPVAAALASFLVGSAALALLLLANGAWPARSQLLAAPAWAWAGGVLGAFYVVSTIVLGPRLGAAALLSLVILGQLLTSLVVDHYGWLGFPEHPMTLTRLRGRAAAVRRGAAGRAPRLRHGARRLRRSGSAARGSPRRRRRDGARRGATRRRTSGRGRRGAR